MVGSFGPWTKMSKRGGKRPWNWWAMTTLACNCNPISSWHFIVIPQTKIFLYLFYVDQKQGLIGEKKDKYKLFCGLWMDPIGGGAQEKSFDRIVICPFWCILRVWEWTNPETEIGKYNQTENDDIIWYTAEWGRGGKKQQIMERKRSKLGGRRWLTKKINDEAEDDGENWWTRGRMGGDWWIFILKPSGQEGMVRWWLTLLAASDLTPILNLLLGAQNKYIYGGGKTRK